MGQERFLFEQIVEQIGKRGIKKIEIPLYIKDNLKHELRDYQIEAFRYLLAYYEEDCESIRNIPNHMLFQMATGSGKTMIMAGLLLYYYSLGYRNFLFFVNRTNIIAKTKDNFLNKYGSKYLFKEHIYIDNKEIFIKEVDSFENSDKENINIIFKTTSGLLSDLEQNIKENSVNYEDFKQHNIVLISDEAHHINTETKRNKTKEETLSIHSWEGVVQKIFNNNIDNVLLEFTATADLQNPLIRNKYIDKLIYDYDLKHFREDGFSKNIYTSAVDTEDYFIIALRGIILSQYRKKIFEKYRQNIKPVVLIKSSTISESTEFQQEFKSRLNALTENDLQKLQSNSKGIINKVFTYLNENNISYTNFIEELKEEFNTEKQISVNNKSDDETKQMYLNTLEDKNNPYRLVFAVDKLNEGWDVLNLFDIVRYKATNTTQDAQLIGRGARYCPFVLQEGQDKYKRKYDKEETELSICESMYYHATNNSQLIAELNQQLRQDGILPQNEKVKRVLKIKDSFKESDLYKSGVIFVNKPLKRDDDYFFQFADKIKQDNYTYKFSSQRSNDIMLVQQEDLQIEERIEKEQTTIYLKNISERVIRKALNNNVFFEFCNLKKYYPSLSSITEFITSEKYLGSISIEVLGTKERLKTLSLLDKYNMVLSVLSQIEENIKSNHCEWYGDTTFTPIGFKEHIDNEKILFFSPTETDDKEFGKSMKESNNENVQMDLSNKDWYIQNDCFGTDEEKYLIKYIASKIDDLHENYEEVYLMRNERYKDIAIYDFEQGRRFEPDFILFLKQSIENKEIQYQFFIEPKGKHLEEKDKWKNEFLKEIKNRYKVNYIVNNKRFNIFGLPFYNHQTSMDFVKEFEKIL